MRDERNRNSTGPGGKLVGGLLGRLLRVPLFYRILLANAAIVLIGTVGGTVFARAILLGGEEFPLVWVVLLGIASLLVTILVNAVILRVALSPLKQLEETAASVHAGDVDARVPYSPLRDRQLERLTSTFNAMLDNLEAYRVRMSGVAARAMNAEEQERKRIARELHDDTAQYLAALLLRLRLLRNLQDQAAREAAIDEFRAEIGEALERIRRFARGLRPPALDEFGLVPALESHARGMAESVGVPIRIDAEPIEDLLSQQAELALYRIAQEAISNAVRHAEPERVTVRLERADGYVSLTVTDDGSGFVLEEVSQSDDSGLGLFGMKERAAYVGGQVRIESRVGQGTEVRALIPISPPRRRTPGE